MTRISPPPRHSVNRRDILQAGSIGLLGISMADVAAWRSLAAGPAPKPKAVIYLFLTGGPSQHDTFDMKPAQWTDLTGRPHQVYMAEPIEGLMG